jgi:hypothetical protein
MATLTAISIFMAATARWRAMAGLCLKSASAGAGPRPSRWSIGSEISLAPTNSGSGTLPSSSADFGLSPKQIPSDLHVELFEQSC